MTTPSTDHGLTRWMWHQLEPIHAVFWSAPEVFAQAAALGYDPRTRWPSYFPWPLAPLGAIGRRLARRTRPRRPQRHRMADLPPGPPDPAPARPRLRVRPAATPVQAQTMRAGWLRTGQAAQSGPGPRGQPGCDEQANAESRGS